MPKPIYRNIRITHQLWHKLKVLSFALSAQSDKPVTLTQMAEEAVDKYIKDALDKARGKDFKPYKLHEQDYK